MSKAGQIAQALSVAARARLTLAGELPGGGFWTMPQGRDFVLACWRQNVARARRLRLSEAQPRFLQTHKPGPRRTSP